MWIGVLGPLAVRADRPVEIADPRQRALLALLAARRHRSISAGRIAATLWPGEIPSDTGQDEPVAVLVAALGDAAPGLVETSPAGYRLAATVEIDAERYAELVGAARRSVHPDPGRALELLDRADRLIRGEPFADVPRIGEIGEVARMLDEVALVSLETRAGALTAVGRAAEAIPILQDLTVRDPVRERPVAVLVHALATLGRTEEAARTFERWRVRLVEELGVEPSPEAVAHYRAALASAPINGARPWDR